MNIKERLEKEINSRLEFLRIIASGKPMQMARAGGDAWVDYNGTGYCDDCKYRLKPDKPIERWGITDGSGIIWGYVDSRDMAERRIENDKHLRIVHLREVICTPKDDAEK